MLKTTIAFTVQKGSDAYNVLPQEAYVGANMRFIPHQGEKESLEIIKKVADKYGLETEVLHANDYTPPVDIHGEAPSGGADHRGYFPRGLAFQPFM